MTKFRVLQGFEYDSTENKQHDQRDIVTYSDNGRTHLKTVADQKF